MAEKIIEIKKGDKLFPEALKTVVPEVKQIYCIGNPGLLDTKMAAVAGSRKCSE